MFGQDPRRSPPALPVPTRSQVADFSGFRGARGRQAGPSAPTAAGLVDAQPDVQPDVQPQKAATSLAGAALNPPKPCQGVGTPAVPLSSSPGYQAGCPRLLRLCRRSIPCPGTGGCGMEPHPSWPRLLLPAVSPARAQHRARSRPRLGKHHSSSRLPGGSFRLARGYYRGVIGRGPFVPDPPIRPHLSSWVPSRPPGAARSLPPPFFYFLPMQLLPKGPIRGALGVLLGGVSGG